MPVVRAAVSVLLALPRLGHLGLLLTVSFCVQFGEPQPSVYDSCARVALGCLGKRNAENWPLRADSNPPFTWGWNGDNLSVGQTGDLMWLCALGNAADATLEAVTEALYCDLFAALGQEWQLQRIWHYLPRINEPGAGGLERYRAFCSGRSRAFEMTFGADFQGHLPAASAVGCEGDQLVIYACARRNAQVRFFENPLQTPAYRYSQEYGPRAPGFARASVTRVAGKTNWPDKPCRSSEHTEIYLSGTASIRNEHSLVDGGISGQLEITVENLNRIAAECGLEHFLEAGVTCTPSQAGANAVAECNGARHESVGGTAAIARRCFKVYLRNADDYPQVSSCFNALLCDADEVIYLRSDICRAELDIEIEASVLVTGA